MKQNTLIKRFGVLCLAGFLMTTPNIFAENESEVSNNAQNENNNSIGKKLKKNIINQIKNLKDDYKAVTPRNLPSTT